jgi:hypothetical protein
MIHKKLLSGKQKLKKRRFDLIADKALILFKQKNMLRKCVAEPGIPENNLIN